MDETKSDSILTTSSDKPDRNVFKIERSLTSNDPSKALERERVIYHGTTAAIGTALRDLHHNLQDQLDAAPKRSEEEQRLDQEMQTVFLKRGLLRMAEARVIRQKNEEAKAQGKPATVGFPEISAGDALTALETEMAKMEELLKNDPNAETVEYNPYLLADSNLAPKIPTGYEDPTRVAMRGELRKTPYPVADLLTSARSLSLNISEEENLGRAA